MSKLHDLNAHLREIKAHILVSNAPSLIFIGILPLLGNKFELSLKDLGVIFFICRLSITLGSYLNKYLLNKFKVLSIIFSSEIITFLIMSIFLVKIDSAGYLTVTIFISLRSFLISIVSNSRSVIFKKDLTGQNCENIISFNSAVSQFFYIFAGLIYLYDASSIQMFKAVIVLDALSSLYSSYIIYKLKSFNKNIYQLTPINSSKLRVFRDIIVDYKYLLISTLFFATAFGGSDILCYVEGFKLFQDKAGYGFTTILYSVGFYLGYKLTSKFSRISKAKFIACSIIIVLLFFLLKHAISATNISTIFLLIICIYGYLYIFLEKVWVRNISQENSSRIFALKDFIITSSLAFGELIYSSYQSHSYSIRIVTISIFILIVTSVKINYQENLHD